MWGGGGAHSLAMVGEVALVRGWRWESGLVGTAGGCRPMLWGCIGGRGVVLLLGSGGGGRPIGGVG